MSLHDALCWGAGGRRTVRGAPDGAALLEAARYHRLGARLALRARREDPPWLDAGVRDGLEAQRAEAEDRAGELALVACEITGAFAPGDEPVVLKGAFAHALSGGAAPARWSTDLDLLTADFEHFAAVVARLGFVAYSRDPSPHELGYFVRDGVVLDVHRSVSVYQAPAAGLRARDLPAVGTVALPAAAGGQGLPAELSHRDVAAWSRRVVTPHGTYPAPGPELAVLLAAAHTYRNYVSIDFPIPYGTARLGELADIADVVAAPGFDAGLLQRLAGAHGAGDALAFTGTLLASYLGHDPLAGVVCPPGDPLAGVCPPGDRSGRSGDTPGVYGRCLWWDETTLSFFVETAALETPAELAVRTLGMGSLVDLLGAGELLPGVAAGWLGATPGGGRHLATCLTHGPPSLAGTVTAGPSGAGDLAVQVELASAAGRGEVDVLYLNFGDVSLEFVHDPASGALTALDRTEGGGNPPGGQVRATAGARGGRTSFAVVLPLADLAARGAGDLPFLLGVRRRAADHAGGTASALLPLRARLRG